jgi:hypothetical protein
MPAKELQYALVHIHLEAKGAFSLTDAEVMLYKTKAIE